jgi:hypothetical protein
MHWGCGPRPLFAGLVQRRWTPWSKPKLGFDNYHNHIITIYISILFITEHAAVIPFKVSANYYRKERALCIGQLWLLRLQVQTYLVAKQGLSSGPGGGLPYNYMDCLITISLHGIIRWWLLKWRIFPLCIKVKLGENLSLTTFRKVNANLWSNMGPFSAVDWN